MTHSGGGGNIVQNILLKILPNVDYFVIWWNVNKTRLFELQRPTCIDDIEPKWYLMSISDLERTNIIFRWQTITKNRRHHNNNEEPDKIGEFRSIQVYMYHQVSCHCVVCWHVRIALSSCWRTRNKSLSMFVIQFVLLRIHFSVHLSATRLSAESRPPTSRLLATSRPEPSPNCACVWH